MNRLLEKFNEYKSLVNYRMEYTLEDNSQISFKLKQTDFPHLIGLHKLIDIPIIRQFNDNQNKTVSAKYIISKIKQQELLTEDIIRNSSYFRDIQKRFENFSRENFLTISYTEVIINFDASLIGSNLRADYILFELKEGQGYNHLCIAGKAEKYVESFFYNPTDLYIRNQVISKVKKVKIYDNNGNLYLEDNLDNGLKKE